MSKNLPKELLQLFCEQYGAEVSAEIARGIAAERPLTLRVNRLKSDVCEILDVLHSYGAELERVRWYEDAIIIKNWQKFNIKELDIYKKGKIYLQSLSSMLPPLFLQPRAGESILDMAAAPGGKTTQIAAMSQGLANVTACEKNKIRAERMRFNLERQGAGRVSVMVCDARNLDRNFRFDKILLDAPCSGSGTESTFGFTRELYERSARTQRELIFRAAELLPRGGRLVYSTCSLLEKENCGILEAALERGMRLLEIPEGALPGVPRLPTRLPGTLCVMPGERFEGFFVGVLEKG